MRRYRDPEELAEEAREAAIQEVMDELMHGDKGDITLFCEAMIDLFSGYEDKDVEIIVAFQDCIRAGNRCKRVFSRIRGFLCDWAEQKADY